MSVCSSSCMSEYSLPRLGTANNKEIKEDNLKEEVNREFKTGATYTGQLKDNKKAGRGVFTWPNGAKYDGEFLDNVREGHGIQVWADGSVYNGDFHDDMRHGHGTHTWADGESYVGTFYRDRRHGSGTYSWPDGISFTGTFFMDRREGYGSLLLANGSKFEGLYKNDEREGPGVLTYEDGKQDVGLWHRQKLIKLCTALPGAFNMKDHPEFDYYPEEHQKQILPEVRRNQREVINGIINPPEQFNYPPEVDIAEKTEVIFNDSLSLSSTAMDVQQFEQEFFKDVAEKREEQQKSSAKVYAWNHTQSSIAMQRHVIRHQCRQDSVKFDVEKVIKGERSGFGEKGEVELASEELIKAAMEGNHDKVMDLISNGDVHPDVSDRHGHTALLGAAVNWHQDIINTLLDNGSDVNRLNNEGVSALAACHVYFYPTERFKYNIAERYLERPADFEQEKGYDVFEVVRSQMPSSPTRKKSNLKEEKKQNQIDTKKIQKLRQEYSSMTVQSAKGKDSKISVDSGIFNESSDRKLGTLQVKRVKKTDIDDTMAYNEDQLTNPYEKGKKGAGKQYFSDDEDYESETEIDDFESLKSVRNLPIPVSDQMIERCATQLSANDMIVGRQRSAGNHPRTTGTVRRLAMDKSHHLLMETTIRLLLKRGADPNSAIVPMPVLFFAVKAGDVAAVRELLVKGAFTKSTLSEKMGGLAPLHIAAAIPGEEGVQITELLLHSLAHPDVRATEDDSFLNKSLEEEWNKDAISDASQAISGGRTPLQVACARDDNYRNACRVVRLLLAHHANPNLMCNGHSPLALAIASGNDLAIDELLLYGADPCLPLTHGVGSALCIASSTEYENRRTPDARIKLIDKLIKAGADILAPIPIGPKRVTGTAVDYAYYMYNLDRRIAHMPYHALTLSERETFNARRALLAHLGDTLRNKAVEREKQRLMMEEKDGRQSRSPSPNFVYTGAGAAVPATTPGKKGKKGADGHVSFGKTPDTDSEAEIRKPMLRYCYECGRSVGIRLSPCTRCKEVYYCSKACKLKAWNARHKEECVRVGGRSKSPSPNRAGGGNRIDSPTPATDPDHGKPNTVAGIMSASQRIKLPPIGDRNGVVYMKSGDFVTPPGSFPGSPTSSKGSRRGRVRGGRDKKSVLRRSASWDGSESGSSLTWIPKKGVKENNWVSPKVDQKSKRTKKGQDPAMDELIKKGGKKGSKGLEWMDIAHNTLTKKPPKVPNGTQVLAVKVPVKGRSQSAHMGSAISREEIRMMMDKLKALSEPSSPYEPWRFIDGKWIYVDNYSYV